jgi:hypothetical protein
LAGFAKMCWPGPFRSLLVVIADDCRRQERV